MMARRRKRSKKWISTLFILILLVAACVIVYLVWDNYFNDDKDKSGVEETAISEEEKPEEETEPIEEQEIVEKEETIQYEGENPNSANELSGVVTYAGAVDNKLMIRVNINQYLSGGSCSLRLLFEGDVNMYGEVVEIVDSASTSTCAGFDVPLEKLSSGHYLIIINVASGDKTGVINGEVDV